MNDNCLKQGSVVDIRCDLSHFLKSTDYSLKNTNFRILNVVIINLLIMRYCCYNVLKSFFFLLVVKIGYCLTGKLQ